MFLTMNIIKMLNLKMKNIILSKKIINLFYKNIIPNSNMRYNKLIKLMVWINKPI